MLKLLAKLPLPALYVLSSVLSWLAYRVVRFRRKIVFAHLNQAFPERSEREIQGIAKDFYRNLTDIAVETIKGGNLPEEEFKHRVKIKNPEVLQDLYDSGQSFIVLGAHFNNWEWMLMSVSWSLPIPLTASYKPLHDSASNRYIHEVRSRFGGELVALKEFTNTIIKRRKNQHAYSILADQKPPSNSRVHTTTFLNRETRFFVGPEKIAHFADMPVMLVKMFRLARGFYEVEFEVIAEPPYEKKPGDYPIIERYVREVEDMIHQQPESFLWVNRRWRDRSAERRKKKRKR